MPNPRPSSHSNMPEDQKLTFRSRPRFFRLRIAAAVIVSVVVTLAGFAALLRWTNSLTEQERKEQAQVDSYFHSLEIYPDGYPHAEIEKQLDPLIFKTLKRDDFSSFNRYLSGLSSKNKDVLLARMEPLMFEWAKQVDTVESYDKYLSHYPNGAHLREVQTNMDPVFFKKAQKEDWYSTYEEYIKKCPNGQGVQKATDRLEYLKANKAIVEIQFPKVVEQGNRLDSNVPNWGWTTVFKEKGGKVAYKVSASGHIEDPRGRDWGSQTYANNSLGPVRPLTRREVKVRAGGADRDPAWCSVEQMETTLRNSKGSHVLCNGYAIFYWEGEDAGGHPIKLEEKVKLQHTECPGSIPEPEPPTQMFHQPARPFPPPSLFP
ncbi:MAG: hypothetical protein AB1640_11775 [bacterium]